VLEIHQFLQALHQQVVDRVKRQQLTNKARTAVQAAELTLSLFILAFLDKATTAVKASLAVQHQQLQAVAAVLAPLVVMLQAQQAETVAQDQHHQSLAHQLPMQAVAAVVAHNLAARPVQAVQAAVAMPEQAHKTAQPTQAAVAAVLVARQQIRVEVTHQAVQAL
jgi:hypothetical protein